LELLKSTSNTLGRKQFIEIILENKRVVFRGNTTYSKGNLTKLRTDPKFDVAKKTVLYFYGSGQGTKTRRVKEIRNAYVNANYNFLLFDLNSFDYSFFVRFT
jgi:hypothetical protein